MKKRIAAAAGLAAGLTGGAIAGVVLTHPSVSGAQTETTTAPAAETRGGWVEDALAPLVDNGTITQSQADAVIAALEDAKPEGRLGHLGGPGGPGRGFGRMFALESAADAIGISTDDLRTALQSGQSLAEVAEANGKTAQAVVDALVADAKERVDEKVASGDLTQAEADERLASITERITAMVNGEMPDHPGGFRESPPTTAA